MRSQYTFSVDLDVKGSTEPELEEEAIHTYRQLCKAIHNASDYLIANITIQRLEPLVNEMTSQCSKAPDFSSIARQNLP